MLCVCVCQPVCAEICYLTVLWIRARSILTKLYVLLPFNTDIAISHWQADDLQPSLLIMFYTFLFLYARLLSFLTGSEKRELKILSFQTLAVISTNN